MVVDYLPLFQQSIKGSAKFSTTIKKTAACRLEFVCGILQHVVCLPWFPDLESSLIAMEECFTNSEVFDSHLQ